MMLSLAIPSGGSRAAAPDAELPADSSMRQTEVTEWLSPDTAFGGQAENGPAFLPGLPLLRIPSSPLDASTPHGSHGERTVDLRESHPAKREPSVASEPVVASTAPTDRDAQSSHPVEFTPVRSRDAFSGLKDLERSHGAALQHLPRLAMTTLFVVGICVGTLAVGRRWMTSSGCTAGQAATGRLQLVASLTIAARTQLHVVRFDDRDVLVGVDSRGLQQVQLISPSFEAALRKAQEPEQRSSKAEETPEMRGGGIPRRLFTAA